MQELGSMPDLHTGGAVAYMLAKAVCETVTGICLLPLGCLIRICRKPRQTELHYEDTELNRFIVDKCPSLGHYRPAPWAPGPCSQTVYAAMVRTEDFHYDREMVRMMDGVKVALDWCPFEYALSEDAPVILCLHGIGCNSEGKSNKLLMQHCIRQRLRGVVYNRRGHGGTSLAPDPDDKVDISLWKPVPLHADTDDLEEVVQHIARRFPEAKIICVGFSLGSNLLLRYLGTIGDACRIYAAISVANGFDMVQGSKDLQTKNPAMDSIVTGKLRSLIRTNSNHLLQYEGMDENSLQGLMRSRSLREFDSLLVGKVFGIKDVDEYYSRSSCFPHLQHITCPVFILGDRNDPLISQDLLCHARDAARTNPNCLSVVTENGGHLGWLEGWRGGCWSIKVCGQYIDAVLGAAEVIKAAEASRVVQGSMMMVGSEPEEELVRARGEPVALTMASPSMLMFEMDGAAAQASSMASSMACHAVALRCRVSQAAS